MFTRALTLIVLITIWSSVPSGAANNPTVDIPSLYQRSYDLEKAEDYMTALQILEAMPEAEKTSYAYVLRVAWLEYLAGKFDDSITHYRAAAMLVRNAVEPLLGLGLAQAAARRWRDTADTLGTALRIAPSNPQVQLRLAYALYQLGRFSQAEQHYRRVLTDFPSMADARAGLGWSLLMQGRMQEAEKEFEQVLRFVPNQASAKEGVARARG